MPLARILMYAQGVELYCAPTVDDREAWISTVRHIAQRGSLFRALSSCQFLPRSAYPTDWLDITENLPDLPIRGGSCIIRPPLGELLAETPYTARRPSSPRTSTSPVTTRQVRLRCGRSLRPAGCL